MQDNINKDVESNSKIENIAYLTAFEESKKARILRNISVIVALVLSAIIRGISSYSFIAPNNFAVGGVTGIAVMLQYATGINQGVYFLVLNIPILIISFISMPKRFSFLTLCFIVVNSLTTILIEILGGTEGNLVYHDSDPAIISAVFGGVMFGFSLVLVLRIGGAQGGTDVIATIVQKKRPDISISWIIFALDSIVVFVSYFVYDNGLTPILLAIVQLFSATMVSDHLLKGSKSAIKAEIVTNYCEEISAEILAKLGRGVTVLTATGKFTESERKLIITVIRRRQLGELERIVKKYPETFSYIGSCNEVYGTWRK